MHEQGSAPRGLDPIDELARRAADEVGLISFAGGLPDPKLFPRRQLSDAFLEAIHAPGAAALQYGWPEGSLELRTWIAQRLRDRGARVEPSEVIVTSGAQQAIALALATAPRRDTVAVDEESYPAALELFRTAGATLMPASAPAALYYSLPSISNPRGLRMSDGERAALLSRARSARGYVIEDDAYEGTAFSGKSSRPLLADARERVFHVGTFSKTLCPGLRVGWLVPPSRLVQRALRRKQTHDLQANSLAQELLVAYLKTDDFERLQARSRARYARKQRLVAAAARKHLPELSIESPVGGFSLWLESKRHASGEALLEAAIAEGTSFDPGESFRRAPSPRLALRLCYSAVPEADIEPGIERLSRAFRRLG
jgi:2-aminoadipate transaminase